MGNKERNKNLFPCPRCGTTLRIVGVIEELKPISTAKIDDVLHLFSSPVRGSLKVRIEGNHAMLEFTGKYSKSKFNEVMEEVRGYGGRWIKGHFALPIAGLGEEQ